MTDEQRIRYTSIAITTAASGLGVLTSTLALALTLTSTLTSTLTLTLTLTLMLRPLSRLQALSHHPQPPFHYYP